MQQSKNLLLVAALTVSGVVAFSVTPFGVVPRTTTRSSSLSCPLPRESLRAAPTLSSWLQWGNNEPKKEATKTSDDVSTEAGEEVVAEAATDEEVAVVAAAVEEVAAPVSETNGVEASAASAESEPLSDDSSSDDSTKKQSRGPKKSPIKRDRHTVFVGNLPFDITDKELRDLFTDHAKVEFVSIPRNRETGQARGFAFVDVSSAEEVQAVIANINDVMVGGRSLRVTESLPKDDVAKGGADAPQQQPKKKYAEEGVKKIYVGNLPFDTDKDELIEFYGQWGEVKDVYVPIDPASGEARGFAFVSMDDESADKAIEESNGLLYRGRKLAVSVPLPPGEKIQRPTRQQQAQRTKLYVGNLSFYTLADTLRELFEQYGTVYDCYMPEDPETGGSRGFGFITMSAEDAQRAAAEADGVEVDGRQIRVNEAQAKQRASNYDDDE